MAINSDKPDKWEADVARSVRHYNRWFLSFAPKAYQKTRAQTVEQVADALKRACYMLGFGPHVLLKNPDVLSVLRMATAPPIARDRLIGLSSASRSLVQAMEFHGRVPNQMPRAKLNAGLKRIAKTLNRLLDREIFVWVKKKRKPTRSEIAGASAVIADRLCEALADPIVRNAQEKRQLRVIGKWLKARGYKELDANLARDFQTMPPGTFMFRCNVPIRQQGRSDLVNVTIDAVIMPKKNSSRFPLLIEAKSAGDFTNTNKRRKEEAAKIGQLRDTYGKQARLLLFLCGYFDQGYLKYEAAYGIDWVWEHRIDDLALAGL